MNSEEGPEPIGKIESDRLQQVLSVTQAASDAASAFVGRRNREAITKAAVEAMRTSLNRLPISGTIVLGEDRHGPAAVLARGESVGTGTGPAVKIVLDALDGARAAARGGANASTVLAIAEGGGFMSVPDVIMDKIAVGPGLPPNVVDLDETPETNLKNLAAAKGVEIADLVVCMLDRSIHDQLFAQVITAGARTVAILDGDISAIVATCLPDSGVDLYMGSGGAPEGVLAAAALACAGGQMQVRMRFRNDEEAEIGRAWGIADLERKYELGDLVSGHVVFAATGITRGILLRPARRAGGRVITHSIAIDSQDRVVRMIRGERAFRA